MKSAQKINEQELQKITSILSEVKTNLSSLKVAQEQIIDADLQKNVNNTIGILDWTQGYLNILVENPALIKRNGVTEQSIDLAKILDGGELLKFYNKNADHPTHKGTVEFKDIVQFGRKILLMSQQHISEVEELTHPKP